MVISMNFLLLFFIIILPVFQSWEFPSEEGQIEEEIELTLRPRSINSKEKLCNGPFFGQGVCKNIKECPSLMNELKRIPDNENYKNYLKSLWEICGKIDYDVCCDPEDVQQFNDSYCSNFTKQIPKSLPTPEEGCGFTTASFKKIVGGHPSKIGAWPWIALIGNDDSLADSPFICQGTIITMRHILTAAHCLRNGVSFVRLGEYDLNRDDETKHEDIKVIRYERHENYNRKSGRSDIALLYLERNIDCSELILPICLPQTPKLQSKSYMGYSPFIAGWGRTSEDGDISPILLELKINIFENELCKDRYRKRNLFRENNQFDRSIICAGDLGGGKDTCFGDSGGPLMISEDFGEYYRFYLIGVVAYGDGCGRQNIPGVYTSTQYFMDWIKEKIADT